VHEGLVPAMPVLKRYVRCIALVRAFLQQAGGQTKRVGGVSFYSMVWYGMVWYGCNTTPEKVMIRFHSTTDD
jgi:hypothetical protein